jgi:hypothetical protein
MPTVTDSNVVCRSQVLNINSVNYVADQISISYPSKVIERTDENDAPSGQVIYSGFPTGSATLQYAAANTVHPPIGGAFNIVEQNVNIQCFVSETGSTISKDAETKCPISFRVKVSSI